jgi:ribose transport system ATP-binding protein
MPPVPSNDTAPALEFERITRSFFGVPVLKGVSITVGAGRTVGLVGENGAGKSTLMNILGGNLAPDSGCMRLAGAEYAPSNPRDAARAGIAFIHQELNLFGNLSIAENLFLAAFPTRCGFVDRRRIHERTREALEQAGLKASPDTPVDRLSAGERQLVEIARALSADARLIILDEPTTSLTARETEHLFALMGRLRERGIAMIYISHALNDVMRLADDIVVLRDGEVVGAGSKAEFNIDRMITMMVGRSMEQLFPERAAAPHAEAALEVRGVTLPGMVRDVSFTLGRGEILGIAGLMGSGRTELARILFGLDPMQRGEIRLAGAPIHGLPPRQRMDAGLAFLTEDRREEGLCMEASIADNLALAAAPRHASRFNGWLDQGAIASAVKEHREAVRLTPSARDAQPVKTLSGGNQQKVVLAKWLMIQPKVFILDEPTRGIDVGAKQEIYRLINQLTASSAAALVISSEIEELIGLCDRILVMNAGEVRGEFARAEFDREAILRAALK